MTHFVFATFFLHQPVFAVDDVEHVYSIVLDVLHMLEYLQSFEHHNSWHNILHNFTLPHRVRMEC